MDQRNPAKEAVYQTKKCCHNDSGNKDILDFFFCIGVISLDLIVLHFAHKRVVRTRCLQSVLANQKACYI